MVILQLSVAALLPVIFSVFFFLLEKKTKFAKLPYMTRQIIIGVVFGGIACLGTQFGIPTQGVQLNVRGAAPLSAGLIFGGPAGIIAGVIGAVFRYASIYWGVGSYTVVACSLGTLLAGIIGALCRKFMFDNKKTSAIYGLFISMTVEIVHMLLVFFTHLDEVTKAFTIVKTCALPMIIFNGISVFLSMGIITLMGREKKTKKVKRKITQTFSIALLASIIIAFFLTSGFTFAIQDGLSETNINKLLSMTIDDTKNDIINAANENVLRITQDITEDVSKISGLSDATVAENDEQLNQYCDYLSQLADYYEVDEINVFDKSGVIVSSNDKDYIGFDLASNPDGQATEFSCLLNGETSYVQEYMPTDYDSSVYRKYAGATLPNGGFVQVGYCADHFKKEIYREITILGQNRHIDQTGAIVIVDAETKKVVSSTGTDEINSAIEEQYDKIMSDNENGEITTVELNGEDNYYMQDECEGYTIIGYIPMDDAYFNRDLGVYMASFMQVIIFSMLFVLVYILIKKIIVNNLLKVNDSLAKIASGKLDTIVDVRDNEEFSSLSDDINYTVDTLKHYIGDAEDRVHKELEFAKAIQISALPGVFPPYPNRNEFEIYATMKTAKEVGGDFYDFYFVGENKLAILIADVSGKGVPAAMFMMTAKTMIKNLAETGMPVNEVLTSANNKLCEMNNAGMFVTVWMGILDLSTGNIEYVSAGHNPPLIQRGTGEFEYLRGRSGLVLAGMEGISYKSNSIQLMPSDKILLYTDGVTESTNINNELYGEDRLVNYLNGRNDFEVKDVCDGILGELKAFTGEATQFDDITMLMLSLERINGYNSVTLAPNKNSVGEVVDFVENWMVRTKVDAKIIKKVNIIVDEIYSNIVNYSEAKWAKVIYTRDVDNIYLTFTDDGLEYNPLQAKEPDISLSADERVAGGLGILMVKKMAKSVDYKYDSNINELKITIAIEN